MRSLIGCAFTAIVLVGCDDVPSVEPGAVATDSDFTLNAPRSPAEFAEISALIDAALADTPSNSAPDVTVETLSASTPPTTDISECTSVVLDFETDPTGAPINAGQPLTNAYISQGIRIFAFNANMEMRTAIAFDSTNPTGGDADLGTPNADFGGPGRGKGGKSGAVGENAYEMGNVMILSEDDTDADGDGLVDVPDDEAKGGWLIIFLGREYCINDMTMIDIESAEDTEVIFYDRRRRPINELIASGYGNNSIETISPGTCGVQEIWVYLSHSGAVDEIDMCQG